ncbi:GTP pyrophosphokinase [Candidatus Pacearchaeota archaeon]|nr:GTP pyrophosphokinase [Candidatus Pacearchaeota archaeon]
MYFINQAITMAVDAHDGQVDEKGFPYIYHPIHVMNSMPIDDTDGRIVAVLHDVLEDTKYDAEDLTNYGFSADIVSALIAITKEDGEDYDAYLERVKANPLALRVKLKDVAHNKLRSYQDLADSINSFEKDDYRKADRRIDKYRKAINYLEAS